MAGPLALRYYPYDFPGRWPGLGKMLGRWPEKPSKIATSKSVSEGTRCEEFFAYAAGSEKQRFIAKWRC